VAVQGKPIASLATPLRRRERGRFALRSVSLLWLLFAGTAALMVAAAAVLALTPASVHASITSEELVGLLIALAVMLAVELAFLRVTLAPLRRLTTLMGSIDLLQPGQRLGESRWSGREIAALAHAFDTMLERIERERRDSMSRVLSAQETERLRVARELHDEIGQILTALLLRVEHAAADGAGSEDWGDTAAELRRSVDTVRRIARELRPEALDDLGLREALAAMCSRMAQPRGPAIVCELAGELPELGPEADLAVYRVAQEAVTNAVRHASASRVELTLTREGGVVTLAVEDDGRGIDGAAREGAGVMGMRERALLLGARLDLASAPGGRGARLRLAVPVPGAVGS
jgi:two-component system sensor histidine kinase UhpB